MNKEYIAPRYALAAVNLIRAIEFFPKNYIWEVHSGLINTRDRAGLALIGSSTTNGDYGVLNLNSGNVSVYEKSSDGNYSYFEAEWQHMEEFWLRDVEHPDDSDIWIEQYWRPGESPADNKIWKEWNPVSLVV